MHRNETYTTGRRTSKMFIACGRSDVTPTMTARTITIDMEVKWQFNPRKRIYFEHGGFLWNFLQKPH
jgi:regulator of protease activity HflC (stomatin/prohibitin superfamily)